MSLLVITTGVSPSVVLTDLNGEVLNYPGSYDLLPLYSLELIKTSNDLEAAMQANEVHVEYYGQRITALLDLPGGVLSTELTGFLPGTNTIIIDGDTIYKALRKLQAQVTAGGGGSSLPDQTGNSGKFLTTDGVTASWDSVNSVIWGNITGTLADQLDLQAALDGKLDTGATTDDITEGTNLYYTTGRFNTAFGLKSTSDLSEGSNLYYTTARFDTRLATKSTTDLAEGSNLYFTNARVISALPSQASNNGKYLTTNGTVLSWATVTSGVAWGAITGTLSTQTDLQNALDAKVTANAGITGATKTKITYDAKGLVTAGADATTSDIAEGSNLYYTTARFDTRLALKTTTDLTEGSNLYYTTGRFDTRFALKTTTDLAEGSNLYYTTARFDTALATKTTSNLTEGSNLYFTNARAIASVLTGYTSGAGTVASTDTILQAIQKLNGNDLTKVSSITVNTSGVLYTTPINFSIVAGAATGALTLQSQSANTIFSGPSSGGAATPSFRTIVTADLPPQVGATGITVDGQGGVVTIGSKGFVTIPFAGTVTSWYLIGDQSGSIQFDIKRGGTSIIGAGNKPILSSAQRNNAAPSSWTSITIAQNDELEFYIDSVTTLTRVTLVVNITKS